MKWAAALLVVVVAAWAWARHGRAANEHALATVASELAARDAHVRCQSFLAELFDVQSRDGEVPFPDRRRPDHMYLTRTTCRELERFRSASAHPELDCLLTIDWPDWDFARDFNSPCAEKARRATQASTILAHESMHLRGFADEAQAQCYAIQEVAWTVVRLGGTRAEGAAAAEFALAQQPGLPSEYQSGACRSGGGLDLYPKTNAFPTEDPPALPPPRLYGPALGTPFGR